MFYRTILVYRSRLKTFYFESFGQRFHSVVNPILFCPFGKHWFHLTYMLQKEASYKGREKSWKSDVTFSKRENNSVSLYVVNCERFQDKSCNLSLSFVSIVFVRPRSSQHVTESHNTENVMQRMISQNQRGSRGCRCCREQRRTTRM